MTCPSLTTAYHLIRLQLLFSLLVLIATTSHAIKPATMNQPSIRRVVATLRTVVRLSQSSRAEEPVAQWRVFNECSQGFLQSFLHTVNALGRHKDSCLTHFIVWMRHTDGTIALQNEQTRQFVCLNRRIRPTTSSHGLSTKCRFREHMDRSGYTLLESAWYPGVFLGFDKSGHSINSFSQARKQRCFLFNKLESLPPKPGAAAADCTAVSRHIESSTEFPWEFADSNFIGSIFQKSS